MSSKKVTLSVLSREQSEGVGARVRRSIGRPELKNLDPFLLFDEFKGGRPGGFPDHPHRGFETVSYLLEGGSMAHEDFCGHAGQLNPGDLQWMTAGQGIMHAEMPCSEEPVHGLQLWVNLRSSQKMVKPRYQELKSDEIPKPSQDGVTVAVISGEALGIKGWRLGSGMHLVVSKLVVIIEFQNQKYISTSVKSHQIFRWSELSPEEDKGVASHQEKQYQHHSLMDDFYAYILGDF